MTRYFIDISYKGTAYAGFQIQQNANTIQAEMEKALLVFTRHPLELTGSSRTDAGVHARQNFFHFDAPASLPVDWSQAAYHLNAILPADIAVNQIRKVAADAHCRFDATARTYEYTLYNHKDPFLDDRAYFYPYALDLTLLNQAAALLQQTQHFETFAKRNTQVHTYQCSLSESQWEKRGKHQLVYRVRGNRFLRGMVRGLVGTMLRVGTQKIQLAEFEAIIAANDPTQADFSMPARGLTLVEVSF